MMGSRLVELGHLALNAIDTEPLLTLSPVPGAIAVFTARPATASMLDAVDVAKPGE